MPRGVYKHRKGYHLSDETKAKIGAGNKGKIRTTEFKKKISEALKGSGSFNFGKKLSKETRHKISIAKRGNTYRLGKHHSTKTKNKISISNKGKRRSKDNKNKLSLAKKGKKGELSNGWKGGLTSQNRIIRGSIEFKIWKAGVFIRDNFTCKKCFRSEGVALNAHHIKNFSQFHELRFAIDNGITLCEKCHRDFHKKYGFVNNENYQVVKYIKL